jgi:hypothetical protein
MRLTRLNNAHSIKHKLILSVMRLMMRTDPPDVMRLLFYRPAFFGKPFGEVTHATMRESKEWSVGECELFAAFVSRQNQCPF